MALRWKNFVPNTPLKSSEVNDLANNGCVQIDTATDLDDANLVDANLAFDLGTNTLHQRIAAGVGVDKWAKAGGSGAQAPSVTSGVVSDVENWNGTGEKWRVHSFMASDNLTVHADTPTDFHVYCLGGGGGGGSMHHAHTGWDKHPGGTGVAVEGVVSLGTGVYPITVGAAGGGAGNEQGGGGAGGDSSFSTVHAAGGSGGSNVPAAVNGTPLATTIRGTSETYAGGGYGEGGATTMGSTGEGPGHPGQPGLVFIAYRIA